MEGCLHDSRVVEHMHHIRGRHATPGHLSNSISAQVRRERAELEANTSWAQYSDILKVTLQLVVSRVAAPTVTLSTPQAQHGHFRGPTRLSSSHLSYLKREKSGRHPIPCAGLPPKEDSREGESYGDSPT